MTKQRQGWLIVGLVLGAGLVLEVLSVTDCHGQDYYIRRVFHTEYAAFDSVATPSTNGRRVILFGAGLNGLKELLPDGTVNNWGGGAGSPGGSNTHVQFNDATTFGGEADFTWDKTNNILYYAVGARSTYQTSLSTPASNTGVTYWKTDGKFYGKNAAGTEYGPLGSGGTGTPGGASGDVQYNSGSSTFAGETAFNYSAANNALTLDTAKARQFVWRGTTGNSIKYTGPTTVKLTYSLTMPDTFPAVSGKKRVQVYASDGTSSFDEGVPVGVNHWTTAWASQDSGVTQGQVDSMYRRDYVVASWVIPSGSLNTTDKYPCLQLEQDTRITKVRAVGSNGTTNVTFQIYYGSDISATGTSVFNTGAVLTNNTTGSSWTGATPTTWIANSTPAAGNHVWLKFSDGTSKPSYTQIEVIGDPR